MRNRASSRRGMSMVLVIVCLIVITAIIGAMTRQLAIASRQMRQRSWQVQATLLAESAVERAVFALRSDLEFRNEVWRVTAEEIGGPHGGRVEIEVESGTDSAFTVSVVADYPDNAEIRTRVSKSIVVNVKQKKAEAKANEPKQNEEAE